MQMTTLALLKAIVGLLPLLSLFIPGLHKNQQVLFFLPSLIPLLDEVEDLMAHGGLTRQNMEEAVSRAFGSLVTLYPQVGRIDEADVLEVAGVLFDKITKMGQALGPPRLGP